jgi:Uma2 family endonuclease
MTIWAKSIVSEQRMGFSESRLVDQPGAGVIQIFAPTHPELIGGSTMSADTPTQSTPLMPDPTWVPSPLYRFTLDQYEAMVASGAFSSRDRFHLINGLLVAKTTQNTPHCTADDLCGEALARVLPPGWYVRPSKPIRLPAQLSMPEPDRCVVRGTIRDYSRRSPGPTDVGLVVEVSDTSLAEDRKMAQTFAASGIPVYWIVNLVDRRLEVYTGAGPDGYASEILYVAGEDVPVFLDGVEIGRIAVADILP